MRQGMKGLIITFLFGLLIGGVIGRFMTPWHMMRNWSHEKREDRMLKHFSSKLALDPKQKDQVKEIFKAGRTEMDALTAEFRTKFSTLRTKTADDIRKILNPEQLDKFNKMHEKYEKHWKDHTMMPSPPGEEHHD
jgi:Spy/CpxP family protein refolding chaperone